MKEQGQGGPEGAPTSQSQRNAQLKEAGKDYSGRLSSIRADQDVETFVVGLRQNKEQLLSLARNIRVKLADTVDDRGDNLALGIHLEVALKETYFSSSRPESKPLADKMVEEWREDLDPFESIPRRGKDLEEWREELAFWATERIASKWLVAHPDSKAAKEVLAWNIYGWPDQHHKLLQEMWPSIRVVAIHSIDSQKKK